ncbi:DUF952 domain-containing protein [Planctomycetota bacterium]
MNKPNIIYKICSRDEWESAERQGRFTGSPVDIADGFIHFSTADQMKETAAKHFAGQEDLVLVFVDGRKLGNALRWEVSRGGDLFPHLYAELPIEATIEVHPLPLSNDGTHKFPE